LSIDLEEDVAHKQARAIGWCVLPNRSDYGSSGDSGDRDTIASQTEQQVVCEKGISDDADGGNGHDLPGISSFRHTSVVALGGRSGAIIGAFGRAFQKGKRMRGVGMQNEA
jgi:hypothetical protein